MRELLPDWLLSPAYFFRRAFLTRHRRFRLFRDDSGRFGLEHGRRLPHGRVMLRPTRWPRWEALELEGRIWSFGSSVPWSIWLEPQREAGVLELDLPYGLRGLTARLLPHPDGLAVLELELDEVGALAAARSLLGVGGITLARDVRVAAELSRRNLAQLPGALGFTFAHELEQAEYPRWLAAFQSPDDGELSRLLAAVQASGLRISVIRDAKEDAAEILAQLPDQVEVVSRLTEARGDVVVPLRQGLSLAPHALAILAFVLHRRPDFAFVHADHDRATGARRADPSFMPNLGQELLLSRNPFLGLVALRRSAFPEAPEPLLDETGLYSWGLSCTRRLAGRVHRVPLILASMLSDPNIDERAERTVIAEHLEATGTAADVQPGLAPGLHHVRYRLPALPPKVALVVPTRNAASLVENCVRSIRTLTQYPRYEIHLVDNGSDDPEAVAAFDALAKSGHVLLHRDPGPFNFSALNNAAVRRTDSEIVGLVNNDIEVLHPEWLEEMVSVALQPGVGAVGAKLFYPDGRIQHGGVLVGMHGAADHAYAGVPGNAPGDAQQLLVRREVSAVTAACLVIRRTLYLEVGGLDEEAFAISFNDVDLCLKLGARGYRNIWTPHARLVHHESASREKTARPGRGSRAEKELTALRSRWASVLLDDPYHSPNLSLDSKIPRLAWPPRERRPWSF